MKTVLRRKDKDGLLREAGPLWIGFVFALYRATMSRQWRDNGGITTATRRHGEYLFSLSRFLCVVRFPLRERAGRTPGEKMGVTMDL